MTPPPSYRPPSTFSLGRPRSPALAGAKLPRAHSSLATPARSPSRSPSLRSSTNNSLASSQPQQPVLEVFGDSFAGVFTLLPKLARVHKMKGATARGLGNMSSSTGYGQQLVTRLERARPSSVLLIFGSVDIHIGYPWQLKARQAHALGPEAWMRQSVQSYTTYITEQLLPRMTPGGVIYMSGVQLPVVEDGFLDLSTQKYSEKEGSGVLGPLPPAAVRSHPHDIATRRAMVRAYNHLLAAFCSRYPAQLVFIDINPSIADSAGRVHPQMVDRWDPTNIHLIWETTLPYWIDALPPLKRAGIRLDHRQLQSKLAGFHAEKQERMRRHALTRGVIGPHKHPAWPGNPASTPLFGGGWSS